MTHFHAVTADLHAHIGEAPSQEALLGLFARARSAGIRRIVTVTSRAEEFESAALMAEKANGRSEGPQLLTGFGIHPWFAGSLEDEPDWDVHLQERLLAETREKKPDFPPAVGEIGLDYGEYGLSAASKTVQCSLFRRQLAIAETLKRPVMIHSFGAGLDSLDIVKEFPQIPLILFHGFLGTVPRRNRDERFFFSFSAREVSPCRRRGRETVKHLCGHFPILTESDYPAGGNEPAGVLQTGQQLAELGADPFAAEKEFFDRWKSIR